MEKFMRSGSKIFLVLIGLLLTGLPLAAQSPAREKFQAEIDSLSTSLRELLNRQQALAYQADSLAQDIQRRKQQTPSILQDRALNTALRFSQTLADSLQKLQQHEHYLDRLLRQKAEQLLKILNSDIKRLIEEGEKYKRLKSSVQREQVARELMQCREWQRRCQELLEQPLPPIIIYQVEARPEDTPETLQRKADFLRDQADRLQREVKRLEDKISKIREETQVRQRVADFAADLSLLDPSRESTPVSSAGERGATNVAETGLKDFVRESRTSPLSVYQNWPTNLGDLSVDELKRWEKILQQEKRRRQFQADSLESRAEEIERQRP
jgi:outer membrane murein-binding lipoprotein Lpp